MKCQHTLRRQFRGDVHRHTFCVDGLGRSRTTGRRCFTNNFLRALSLRGEGLARERWYFFTTLSPLTQVKLFGVVVRRKGLAMTRTRTQCGVEIENCDRRVDVASLAGWLPLARRRSGTVYVRKLRLRAYHSKL